MSHELQSLIESWDGLGVVTHFDTSSGVWIFICLHDNTLGPCTGGTRMTSYGSPADGLRDAMRLAEGMTCKWAAVGEPIGGGKAVMVLPHAFKGQERRGLLRRYGRLIESLNGTFRTGEDLGTTSADMQVVAERTRFVHGFHPRDGSKIDPSPFTARGVLAGLKGAFAALDGSDDLRGRSVLVEGVGNVGMNLCRMLAEEGAQLLVSDIDGAREAEASRQLGAEVVPADKVYATECDVYAPCAIGATLNEKTIPQLRCRIVGGSANNQLAESRDAQRLLERDIVYVPDYIINAGGALSFALLDRGIGDEQAIFEKMDTIADTVSEILGEAAAAGESPLAAAQRRVEKTLDRARRSRA